MQRRAGRSGVTTTWIIDSAVLGGGSLPNYLLSDRNAIASDVSRKADAGSHLCGPACDAGVWGRWPTATGCPGRSALIGRRRMPPFLAAARVN
jgi:hypothetical protein